MALPPFTNGFQPFLRNNSDMLLAAGAGLLSGTTPQQQAAGLAQGVAGVRQRNRTAQALRQAGATDLADAIENGSLSGSDAFKLFYSQKLEAEKPRNNFITAGKSIYDTSTGQWISPPGGEAGGSEEYGLNPQYGTDAQGNPVILQLSKGGKATQTQLPEGVQLSKEPIKLDAGTEFILLDPISRQPVGRIPKDLAGAERQKAIGEAEGKADASAPGDMQAGLNAKQLIQDLRNDPNRERGTGFSSLGNRIPGTAGYDYQNKVDQAKSGAFATAIQQMRGLGALSNAEGETATKAVTRMNTATSEEAFMKALDDYEKIIDQGIARAQSRMGGRTLPAPAAQPQRYRFNPATGELE